MKKNLFWPMMAIGLALLIVFGSCNGNSGTDTVETSDSSGNKMLEMKDTTVDPAVTEFVNNVMSVNMTEVELGKLTGEKASSPRVKSYGAMMVDDHNAANNALKSIAMSNNISASGDITADQHKEIDNMKSKRGKDFDKAYIDMMIEGHKKNISIFKDASQNMKNEEVRGFAVRTLPILQKHLDSAMALKSSL